MADESLMGGEFWAGTAGAILGAVIGGLITFAVQMFSLREGRSLRAQDALLRQKALGHALLFKMISISSHLQTLNAAINESFTQATAEGFSGDPWQIVRPLASRPDPVHFTTDEMAMLLPLDDGVFNQVAGLDERHNTSLSAFETYGRRRQELTAVFSAEMHTAERGTTFLTPEQARFVGPRAAELNALLRTLIPQLRQQAEESWAALNSLQHVLKTKLRIAVAIEPINAQDGT